MSQTLHTVAVPTRHRLRPWSSAAGRLFVAYWGSLTVVDLTRPAPPAVAVAALVLLTVLCSCGRSWTTGLAVAAVVWCFLDGFVTHSYGALTPLHVRDVVALAVLGVAATAAGTRNRRRSEPVSR